MEQPNFFIIFYLQASQSGYGVDYGAPGPQAGFPGSYLNQNTQPGYSHLGTGNDFISQVGQLLRLIIHISFLPECTCWHALFSFS